MMANSRKDSRNRKLLTGESERSDGTYMYRYTNNFGQRLSVYAKTLDELRKKERQINKDLEDGVSIKNSNITVSELLDIYLNSNQNWKQSTRQGYEYVIDVIKKHKISQMKISQVKTSNIRSFYMDLNKKGRKKNSLMNYRTVLRCSFDLAVQDDWIRKNPAELSLNFLLSDKEEKQVLPYELENSFLEFVKNNKKFNKYYDIYVLILDTGLRISELLGLTLNDVDLDNKIIYVTHQLSIKEGNGKKRELYISEPKTTKAHREIPLSARAYQSVINIIANRTKYSNVEPIIDGYTKFLFLTNTSRKILSKECIERNLNQAVKKYNDCYDDKLPKMTPHALRHTFCTRMVENGINAHALQYVMGHSSIRTTYEVYTHYDSAKAVDEMAKMIN